MADTAVGVDVADDAQEMRREFLRMLASRRAGTGKSSHSFIFFCMFC
jgi:hypothetical protein